MPIQRTPQTVVDSTPSAILERISLVLQAFEGPGRLNLAQVVRYTGLPRSSAHRMLERLVGMNWLNREGNEYELGTRLIQLGSTAVYQNSVRRAAAPILHELHRVTGYVVHLGVLDGSDVLYLEKIGGRLAAELPTRVGGRLPAHTSAIGKALLACTPSGNDHLADFTPELHKVREMGVSYDRHQIAGGISTIAAPIGPAGGVVAALSICGPIGHLKFDYRHTTPVRLAAGAILHSVSGKGRGGTVAIANHNRFTALPSTGRPPRLRFA